MYSTISVASFREPNLMDDDGSVLVCNVQKSIPDTCYLIFVAWHRMHGGPVGSGLWPFSV